MNTKDKIQIKVDNIKRKLDKNKSIQYYVLTFICVFGFIFFLSSNMLFNKEMSLMSTKLNKQIILNGITVTLKERQYNSTNGLVQFTLKIENQGSDNKNILDFEIREKSNPVELIECKVNKITNSDYVITTKLTKKWDALSLTVISKNSEGETNTSTKIYSDVRDITLNNELEEKEIKGYTIEIIDNEIADIRNEMEQIYLTISEKNSTITELKEGINSLEAEKQYQTSSEIESSTNKIELDKSKITQLENEIKNEDKKLKEHEEKIKKLEEKKKNFQ